jgi:hypothetical protein
MTIVRAACVLPLAVLLGSCRNASPEFPKTPLGQVGRDWLAAHNRAEGHAAVHFTLPESRQRSDVSGSETMTLVRTHS